MADLQKFCDELRTRVSIVDVVGAKVKLIRKGKEHSGLCPFHNEKTPSFTVNEAKGFYHCFGCGAHGDIIKFEMEANNLPFIDVVKKLSDKAGMQMPQLSNEDKEETEKRSSWYEIMELAAKFFEKNLHLTGGRQALDYLYNRGFDDEIINKFRLGYAPSNNGLKAWLVSKNVAERDMIELGLASVSESGTTQRIFDFFRDRVIIPIMDKRGRVIAFGGRIMGEGQPKYLNSPETPVFNKRRVLYNLHNARDKGFEARNIIVCEGYMDVIAMDKYGIGYAVAPLGTALTEDQITEAWKICPEPTLCFDGDSAGIRAAVRSVDRVLPILKAGYSLRFAFLPDKMDPDEYLKVKGKEEFLKIIADTKPLAEILWKKNLEEKNIATPEQKALIEKNIMEEVAKIADEKVRGYYLQEMQNRVYYELGKGSWKPRAFTPQGKKQVEPKKPTMIKPKASLDELVVKFVLAAMIYYPELIDEYEEKMSMFAFPNDKLQGLFDKMVEIYHNCENFDCAKMQQALNSSGFGADLNMLWEVDMFKQQNPYITKIREEIDMKIIEVQLKQLEAEIRECLRVIDISESFPEEVYQRYETLKKEKDALLNTQSFN